MAEQQMLFENYMNGVRPEWPLRKYKGGEYADGRVDFAWQIWLEARGVK